jgi:IMP dehydrogenase
MRQINKIDRTVSLSFADVLLVPYEQNYCTIKSRNDPDTTSCVCPGIEIQVPILAAPMDSVCGPEMAIAMEQSGALGIHTRYINYEDELERQISGIKQMISAGCKYPSCAVGVKGSYRRPIAEHVMELCDNGLRIVCIDIANGNHIFMHQAIEQIVKLKNKYPLSIIAGNVATPHATRRLANIGADCAKVGVGSGASCTTRRVTGFGVPQFTAILECSDAVKDLDICVIADGGIRNTGDMVKSLWAGADVVMAGYLFAGHDECPSFGGVKQYRGMSSRTVSQRDDVAPEGVCMDIQNKGPVKNTIKEMAAAIRAACSMANAHNIKELRENVRAIRVSTRTFSESEPISG